VSATLREALASARGEGVAGEALIALVARAAPEVSPDALLAAEIPGARALWDPAGGERGGADVALCARGETVRLETSGPEKVRALREGAREVFARIAVRRGDGCEAAPAPRMLGGVAFEGAAEHGCAEAWEGFAAASFALPRWSLACGREGAFLQLCARGEELADPTLDAELAQIERALQAAPAARRGTPAAPREALWLRDEMGPSRWNALVDDALARIAAGEFDKVVAARRSQLRARAPIDVAGALSRLRAAQPGCARFAVERAGGVFLGASPEWLAQRHGRRAHADGLAGSRARRPEHDEADAAALRASEKDLREHAIVVDAIVAALQALGARVAAPARPGVRTLRHLHHLWTAIEAVLPADVHALDLLAALHPTPAVCGLPRAAAGAWIARSEPVPRGWYAAPVGWFDAAGDGAFVVGIRSALVRHERAWLYAGAGIVRGSDPVAEFAEAGVKQRPMLQALGVLP
jgi:menaquinone-specific isochorismate synthase